MTQTRLEKARRYADQRQEVTNKLKGVLIDRLMLNREPDEIPDDCLLFGIGLGLDSVDALEIGVAVEMELGVTVGEKDMESFRSINTIIDLIMSRQNREEEQT